MMSTVHRDDQGFVQYTKGAPDEILARCSRIITRDGIKPMTDELLAQVMQALQAILA